jgi:hypothetical protein
VAYPDDALGDVLFRDGDPRNEIVWRTQTTDFWVGFKAFGVIR